MRRLEWTVKALIDLDEAQRYIAQESPIAAQAIAQRIHDAVRLLQSQPDIGSPAHIPTVRVWVVARSPYLIVYRVRGETVEILRLWHGRRDWKSASQQA